MPPTTIKECHLILFSSEGDEGNKAYKCVCVCVCLSDTCELCHTQCVHVTLMAQSVSIPPDGILEDYLRFVLPVTLGWWVRRRTPNSIINDFIIIKVEYTF